MIQETHIFRRLALTASLAALVVMAGCGDEGATPGASAGGPVAESDVAESDVAESDVADLDGVVESAEERADEIAEESAEEIEEKQDMTEPEIAEPVSEPEFQGPRPGLLVTTEWLAEHAQDAGLRIVDARQATDYLGGHVPGAVNIERSATFHPQRPGNLGRPAAIAELFGSMGIDESVHVVLYDEGKSTAAARVFWTLEQYSHPSVSVLDGGLLKWQAEGRELSVEEPPVTPTTFNVRPGDLIATLDHVLAGLDEPETIALDTRSDREWDEGRVPGAVHLEWTENFTEGEVPVFKSVEELTALYEEAGVTRDQRVHTY